MDCSLGLRRFLCDRIWVFPSTHTLFALLAADTALPRIQGVLHTGHLTGHTSRYLTHEGDTLSPSNTSIVATPLSLTDASLSHALTPLSLSTHTHKIDSLARSHTTTLLTHSEPDTHTTKHSDDVELPIRVLSIRRPISAATQYLEIRHGSS